MQFVATTASALAHTGNDAELENVQPMRPSDYLNRKRKRIAAGNYASKLSDPRWQRKRLAVLQNSKWMCEKCGANDKELHVHHLYYKPRTNPWDYPDKDLMVLCWECHTTQAEDERRFASLIHGCNGLLGSICDMIEGAYEDPSDFCLYAVLAAHCREIARLFGKLPKAGL